MRTLFISLLLTMSATSHAVLPNWTEEVDVLALQVHKDAVYIRVTPYTESCGTSTWLRFSGNAELEKRALSGGMAALAAGKKIKVYALSCDGVHLVADRYQIVK